MSAFLALPSGNGRQEQENARNPAGLPAWCTREGKAMRDAVSEKVRNKAYHPKVSSDSHVCQGMCVTRPPQRKAGVRERGGGEKEIANCV